MSRHVLVVGISESGKSIFGKAKAREAMEGGHKVIVFDPTLSAGWPQGSIKYADPELFLTDIAKARNAYVFIDEGADLWSFDSDEADKLLYRGRHRGLVVYVLAQRMNMIRPNARNMASTVIAFRQNDRDDARALAERHPGMVAALNLPRLRGLVTDGYQIVDIEVAYDPERVIVHPRKNEPSEVSDH